MVTATGRHNAMLAVSVVVHRVDGHT